MRERERDLLEKKKRCEGDLAEECVFKVGFSDLSHQPTLVLEEGVGMVLFSAALARGWKMLGHGFA